MIGNINDHSANSGGNSRDPSVVDLRSFIGLTVIGMKPRQRSPLLLADTTVRRLPLQGGELLVPFN
ncbi:MAG: hypothetical protein CMO03_08795 [Thalassospira sp.]|jgi:hypothetical protein|uniref:Uncharacterized protein n=2 Tax=Thalassospira xiamenensis TaxID=220697 RepID=A0ABR5Y2F5_9PROT|nr:hypothetical protein TH3_06790 [Thalassospira xiamenensis M-5 = DSM 17429]KZD04165.1 hypothetical protein AUP40_16010 [Thalassospira xiamenensis]MAB34727.1 hypothetical protein [Thalassospira sp.]OHZ02666.1 hypothetical protein BC440_20915 [Thalassospira sp. MIT1004]KZD05256.1 hypothetical protein AUP45_21085 [Thalassospira xiamenensis]|tara:strand:- start:165 stop:362 length:198 start_codon:yes stop_codon:yes gene_type:complete